MFSSISSSFRYCAALTAAAMVTMSACGGGSDDATSASTDAVSVVTDPADAEVSPVDTDVATTQATTTEPVITEPPVGETPIGTDSSGTTVTQEYCDATRDVFAPGRITRFIDPADVTGFEAAVRAIVDRTDAVIDTAISSDANRIVRDLQDALDELIPILESIGFDPTVDPASLPDGGVRFRELGDTITESRDFFEATLLDDCGYSDAALEDISFDFARSVATLPVTEPGATTTETTTPATTTTPDTGTAPTGDSTRVSDDSGRLTVEVPVDWVDVDGAPGPNEDRLLVSPDAAAFQEGFGSPGLLLEVADTPAGNGAEAYPLAITQITANYERGGCTVISEVPYSDPLYTGAEVLFDCQQGSDNRVIAGTNADGTRIFVLAMILESGDAATRDLIADSFLVD